MPSYELNPLGLNDFEPFFSSHKKNLDRSSADEPSNFNSESLSTLTTENLSVTKLLYAIRGLLPPVANTASQYDYEEIQLVVQDELQLRQNPEQLKRRLQQLRQLQTYVEYLYRQCLVKGLPHREVRQCLQILHFASNFDEVVKVLKSKIS